MSLHETAGVSYGESKTRFLYEFANEDMVESPRMQGLT